MEIRDPQYQSELRIAKAEQEASKKIQKSQERVKEAQVEGQRRVEQIQDQFERQNQMEGLRASNLLETQKHQGDLALRELEKNQNAAVRSVRQDGDRQLNKVQSHYRDTLYNTERREEQKLQELLSSYSVQAAYEKQKGVHAVEDTQIENEARIKDAQARAQNRFEKFKEQVDNSSEKLIENRRIVQEKQEEQFNKNFSDRVQKQKTVLDEIDHKAYRKIEEIKNETSNKLQSFEGRKADPFYRSVEFGARMQETDHAYIIRAHVPEHEQNQVSISVQGLQVVIKGSRKNEEHRETSDGQKHSTSSFQTYIQTIPIDAPIEQKKVQKFFEGDQMTIVLPKKVRHTEQGYKAPLSAKSVVERPQFPQELLKLTETKKPSPGDGTLA